VQSDRGGEFTSEEVARMLQKHGVKQIFSLPYKPQSNGCIERFNRTLKRMLFAHMTQFNTRNWIKALPLLLENYNSGVHSTTGFKPQTLHRTTNEAIIQSAAEKIAKKARTTLRRSRRNFEQLQVGDHVRLDSCVHPKKRKNKLFAKAYLTNWSREIYRVKSISKPEEEGELSRPQYRLTEIPTGKLLKRRFYRDNLLKINLESLQRSKNDATYPSQRSTLFELDQHLKKLRKLNNAKFRIPLWQRRTPRSIRRKWTLAELGLIKRTRKVKPTHSLKISPETQTPGPSPRPVAEELSHAKN
jgi:hypothetical protein